MTLDSSVMNVSIATVAKDVGTTVTGIQGAITAYTLVMDDERTHGAAAADDDRRRFHRIGVEPVIAFPALAGGGTQDVAARNGHARALLGPFGEGSVG